MRTLTVILTFGVTVMLLGCGLLNGGEKSLDSEPMTPTAVSEGLQSGGETSPDSEPMTPTAVSEGSQLGSPPPFYLGPSSLEERILASPVIARVRLDSTTSTVEYGITYQGAGYLALLEFSFSVQEYLKGSGATNIVAVWDADPVFDTQQEAEDALPAIVAARDTQWDDREAIVFLQNSQSYLSSTQQAARYYLSWEADPTYGPRDDNYSIASRYNKRWLPATAAIGAPSQPSGDQQSFLLDVPPATGTAPTITLGEMKSRISTVVAKLNAGDGSEEYTDCVRLTYESERQERHYWQTYPDRSGSNVGNVPPHEHEFDSGLAMGSILYEDELGFGQTADNLNRYWFDGGDVDLFNVEFGEAFPYDFSGDGVNDVVNFTRKVLSVRPLPAGVYRFHFNELSGIFLPCDGYTIRYEWTVTVNAPEGTLHEAFFDPVTDGTAVAADSTNGALDPATFTDANSGSATIERIAWEAGTGESGTVKLKLSLHTGIAGHAVNFIALDGSVSLSLQVADATVDATNETLSWPVASQPWQSGDKLMLRIHQDPCARGAVANPRSNPGLVADCLTLLILRNYLAGTASLNWSAESAMTAWDGVAISGTPKRVTRLDLGRKGLTGVIPPDLGGLAELENLDLDDNQLSGLIPAELGGLSNLQELWLSDNQLSGPIPAELGGLSNLQELWLSDNQLSGPIPAELGSLSNLTALVLGGNSTLSGPLPGSLTGLTSLTTLWLDGTELCAPTDDGFQAWLRSLGNKAGVVNCVRPDRTAPVALYHTTGGPNWDNNNNWLSDRPLGEWHGVTTDGVGRLTGLNLLLNQLSGEIPAELGGLSNLQSLDLRSNELSGEIPTELGGLSNLQSLELGGNELGGPIPAELASLSNLQWLGLARNQLSGPIPTELGNLSNLIGLHLGSNQLSGPIPAELGNLSNLIALYLYDNQLSGEIPAELGNLSNLERLDLGSNQLSGEIPAELGNLSNLQSLSFRGNLTLSGPLPGSLTGLTSLTELSMDGTELCTPMDDGFQAWLQSVVTKSGVVNCV